MATPRLPRGALTLKQYFLRKEVLSLYRQIVRTLREVPDKEHKQELLEWARSEFKQNKSQKDEVVIKMMLSRGRLTLREVTAAITMAK